MRTTITLALCFGLAACVSKQDRPMRYSEDTVLSQEVSKRLDEQDGELDVREHEDIRCERIRIVGTHMITRHCYTLGESAATADRNRNEIERRLSTTPRPRKGN